MGIVQNDIAYYAYNGVVRDDFIAKPIKNIRGLFMLYPEPVQLIAGKDSGIKSPADLKGQDGRGGHIAICMTGQDRKAPRP